MYNHPDTTTIRWVTIIVLVTAVYYAHKIVTTWLNISSPLCLIWSKRSNILRRALLEEYQARLPSQDPSFPVSRWILHLSSAPLALGDKEIDTDYDSGRSSGELSFCRRTRYRYAGTKILKTKEVHKAFLVAVVPFSGLCPDDEKLPLSQSEPGALITGMPPNSTELPTSKWPAVSVKHKHSLGKILSKLSFCLFSRSFHRSFYHRNETISSTLFPHTHSP